MRPFLVAATGIALGLAAVLPLAQAQAQRGAAAGPGVVAAAPGVPQPPSAITVPRPAAPVPARSADPAATTGRPAGQPVLVNGTSVATRYGLVQVQAELTGGRISAVTALTLPSQDGTSRRISRNAGPRLADEAVHSQSAQVDTVSGASYTSDGYRRSLQAALDLARAHGLTGPDATALRPTP